MDVAAAVASGVPEMTDSTADSPTVEQRNTAGPVRLRERSAVLAALPRWDGTRGEVAWHAWFASLDLLQEKVKLSRNQFGLKAKLSKEYGNRLFRDREIEKNWLKWGPVEKMLRHFPELQLERWQELHAATEEFIRSGAPLPPERPQTQSFVGRRGPRPLVHRPQLRSRL